jgi:hypothetical protein
LASNVVAAAIAPWGVQTTHSIVHVTPTRIQVWFTQYLVIIYIQLYEQHINS